MKRYLVTGCYGFIGSQVAAALLDAGYQVVGVDRLEGAQSKKAHRIEQLTARKYFRFVECELASDGQVIKLFKAHKPDEVVHLAAQYAVRHTPEHVKSYAFNNCLAPMWLFEHARLAGHKRFTYASSTFVQDHMQSASLYGATKHFAEQLGSVYGKAHGMTAVGIRYGSTFGPQCRPDVGIYQLAKKLLSGKPIDASLGGFNYQVAFCDVRDAVGATLALLAAELPAGPHTATVVAADHRRDLGELLCLLENATGVFAQCDWKGYVKKPAGGIPYEQCNALYLLSGYMPRYTIPQAVEHFASWAQEQHKQGLL